MTRVLLVDDDADLLEPLGLYLEGRGYEGDLARGAADAARAMAARRPDVVVTDVRLPDGGGEEVALAARAMGARVAGLTGDARPGSGFEITLRKPCSPRLVVDSIERLLATPPGTVKRVKQDE